ncbi:MAG: bifunctional heptose 7-phosphate kinase/heptose 1-phosphate adenyltransferase [Candidatus Kariarchaeaceae archaeon]|jgi:D-beta-D-heptose 7-phosphate kinase/D-beta-D-heptose 1-phosphate adenosyltransferase
MPKQFGFSIDLEIIPPQKQFKVLLIGDSCVDRYLYGTCDRINPEAPVPILKYTKEEQTDGMAWNVRNNLRAFGLDVTTITQEENILKTRFIDERYSQQLLRVDTESEIKPLGYDLPQEKFDTLVISDYDKGFVTSKRLFELVEWFDGPIFIDSKKTCLPIDHAFIKINNYEYEKLEQKDHPNLIITQGSKGALYRGTTYPGEKVSTYDVCGAGDTFLSALVYFYLLYGRIEDAIPYANKAASIAVSNFGTYVLNREDIDEIRRRH